MLIKSCTKENDDCFILFGGSGSELLLCKGLKRNYISCELHPEYYEMILDRLNNESGSIKTEYRIQSIVEKQNKNKVLPPLFAINV
jgi:site-specific DNA-methyltransferase (adenine-specific)